MTELKLFMAPGEEVDLSVLRAEVMRIYDRAFSRIRAELATAEHHGSAIGYTQRILAICEEVIVETDALAQKHRDKYKGK